MPSPRIIEIGCNIDGNPPSLIDSLLHFFKIDKILDPLPPQSLKGKLEKVRDPMIDILMDFNEDAAIFKPDFNGLIDDMDRGSNRNQGIETNNILRVKTYTPMGDQSPNGPWKIGAMNSIPSYGQTQPVRAERIVWAWRN